VRPLRLSISNFRGWKQGTIELDSALVVIAAENRRGKSSTLNALEWCLMGRDVEKKDGSGIDERDHWRVAHQPSEASEATPQEPTRVTLTLTSSEGDYHIERTRVTKGKSGVYTLTVRTPNETLAGERADAWMQHQGLPDWGTWCRAFCQHQELARQRLTDKNERSTLIADLLGLRDYDELARSLTDFAPKRTLLDKLDEEQDNLEMLLHRAVLRPEEDLSECERRLSALGLEVTQAHSAQVLQIAKQMISRASELSADLKIPTAVPTLVSEADIPQVQQWAETWVSAVRATQSTERLSALSKKHSQLSSAVGRLEPLEARWQQARDAVQRHVREHGDEATQKELALKAQAAVRSAETQLRQANALLKLMREAADYISDAHDAQHCPVCDTRTDDLTTRLSHAIAKHQDTAGVALEQTLRDAVDRQKTVDKHLRELTRVTQEETDAARSLQAARQTLSALLSHPHDATSADPLKLAHQEIRALEDAAQRLQAQLTQRDALLDQHRQDLERLRELQKWQVAAARAQSRTNLEALPAWALLQQSLDQAAALAVDVDALARMARQAQSEASVRRLTEVNRCLGMFFSQLTGNENHQAIQVQTHATAKGLIYELVDATGDGALSTWNQASLNALSLALLFAQAQARAQAGLPAWIVLDDPAQSLDAEHQARLAQVVAQLAHDCPVIVASPPCPLTEALMHVTSVSRRVLTLAPWDLKQGARIVQAKSTGFHQAATTFSNTPPPLNTPLRSNPPPPEKAKPLPTRRAKKQPRTGTTSELPLFANYVREESQ